MAYAPNNEGREAFDRAFIAAKDAVRELDRLCEKHDVPYFEYSKVYEAIMGICKEVTNDAESD